MASAAHGIRLHSMATHPWMFIACILFGNTKKPADFDRFDFHSESNEVTTQWQSGFFSRWLL